MAYVESRNRATSDPETRKEVLAEIESRGIEDVLLWFTDLEGHLKSFSITPQRGRGRARRRDGLRRLVDHRLQRDRGVGHGRDPRPGDVPGAARTGGEGGADDLRRRHARRRAVRRRPALRAPPRARADGGDGLRHVQRRPGGGVLPVQGRARDGDARRGRLLRADDARRRDRASAARRSARSSRWASRSSTTTTRSARRSTRSTSATRARSTWPTTCSRTGSSSRRSRKQHGCHATFMPKPMFGENGSGMHTHQSLFTGGHNAFFDGDDKWHLSGVAKAFIAGQLRHARELSAVFAQWVNSYKRLVPGFEAPVYVAWSQRNRSALIRIPLYKPGSEQATRAEIRCPDPGVQPVPDVRRAPPRRARGDRAGLRAARPDGDEPLPPHGRAAPRARHRLPAGDARRGDRRALAVAS